MKKFRVCVEVITGKTHVSDWYEQTEEILEEWDKLMALIEKIGELTHFSLEQEDGRITRHFNPAHIVHIGVEFNE